MPSKRSLPRRTDRALRAARSALRFLPGLVLLVGAAHPAAAQDEAEGLWWAISVGAGSARFTCDLCTPQRDAGPALDFVVGAAASPAVRVGVEGGFWTHLDDGVREWVRRAGVVAHVYPRPGRGLHLIGGAGWSAYRAEETRYDSGRLTVGLGWDFPLTPGWSVGNTVTLDAASFGSIKNDEDILDRDVGLSVLRLGVFLKHR